jgi:hypothetical protein
MRTLIFTCALIMSFTILGAHAEDNKNPAGAPKTDKPKVMTTEEVAQELRDLEALGPTFVLPPPDAPPSAEPKGGSTARAVESRDRQEFIRALRDGVR